MIRNLVKEYYAASGSEQNPNIVPVSGKVFDDHELIFAVDAVLDGWWTSGKYSFEFEKQFSQFMGVRGVSLTNSGSSANLLAVSCLTSPVLGDQRLRHGDEVITVATGFPTTVAPLIQNGLIPVFIDIKLPTYNVDETLLEQAVTPKTRAIVLAHTLGNAFNVDAVLSVARKHNLYVIEDTCDAVGTRYGDKYVGGYGDLATVSFYPAHHITMGEGGAVLTNSPMLKKIVESFRDWGRDCWCDTGCDNTCGIRFEQQFGDLPFGYDHKYVYSHLGYNLKVTEMQAAIGLAQLNKLPRFIELRRTNYEVLYSALSDLQDRVVLPEAEEKSLPSWFGFPITLRNAKHDERNGVVKSLNSRGIATRLLFGGNLTKQPAFKDAPYRFASGLETTDIVMKNTFWVGLFPGVNNTRMEHLIEALRDALS